MLPVYFSILQFHFSFGPGSLAGQREQWGQYADESLGTQGGGVQAPSFPGSRAEPRENWGPTHSWSGAHCTAFLWYPSPRSSGL